MTIDSHHILFKMDQLPVDLLEKTFYHLPEDLCLLLTLSKIKTVQIAATLTLFNFISLSSSKYAVYKLFNPKNIYSEVGFCFLKVPDFWVQINIKDFDKINIGHIKIINNLTINLDIADLNQDSSQILTSILLNTKMLKKIKFNIIANAKTLNF
ncbi:uncharacterized protein ASCRUDRAFT_8674 [Ascoidea rubescens DSM 1968]|uniref:Uncharacterized protein n=1 Tax=Ascoidea rubescens DSM 1968 TaxID=1344418 RepID=A0A1D2VFK5_9ASCO|nr:hypothetical protein ASCRUDRAFT_8674 [Ascoidea rubescens DSM 1968]ODV60454.1 hypothetical protein ASCRUDRAFT_8674 [Ascoidea rubescens DSM 1968]